MRHTQRLEQAIEAAKKCDCIICNITARNLLGAEELWRSAAKLENAHPKWKEAVRKWYRVNWKAAASSLLVLLDHPGKHLKGAPNAK